MLVCGCDIIFKMRSKKTIIANWKMNPSSLKEAKNLFSETLKSLKGVSKTSVILCPPFVYLSNLSTKNKVVSVGAQDVFFEKEGSYTGEISIKQLKDLGVSTAILGHSERRTLGETSDVIVKKVNTCLENNIKAVLCVGEIFRDEQGEYLRFLEKQIKESLDGLSDKKILNLSIAYEPVWAIGGDKKPLDKEGVREIYIFIKKVLSDIFGPVKASKISIIYGGSVNSDNVLDFIKDTGMSGVLVGSSSLNPKEFGEIIKKVEKGF